MAAGTCQVENDRAESVLQSLIEKISLDGGRWSGSARSAAGSLPIQ